VKPAIGERDARTGDQVLHRARDEQLAGAGARGDARADVHRDAAELVADDLTLAGVHSGPDRDPELMERVDELLGATNRPTGPVEAREEAVACRVDLDTPKVVELRADDRMVAIEEVVPAQNSSSAPGSSTNVAPGM
jgi:hypothetical protein